MYVSPGLEADLHGGGAGDVVVEEAVGEELGSRTAERDALELSDAGHPHVGVPDDLHIESGLFADDIGLVEPVRHAGETAGFGRAVAASDQYTIPS